MILFWLHSCMVLQYLDRGSQIDEDLSTLAFHRQLSYKAGKLLRWEDQSDRAVTTTERPTIAAQVFFCMVLQYLDRGSQIDEDLSTLVLHRQLLKGAELHSRQMTSMGGPKRPSRVETEGSPVKWHPGGTISPGFDR